MTATWARLAASASRVKSLRKGSVDDVLAGAGMGGLGSEGIVLMGDCWVDEVAEETERVLMPFIMADSMVGMAEKNEGRRTRDDGCNDRVGFAGRQEEEEEEEEEGEEKKEKK